MANERTETSLFSVFITQSVHLFVSVFYGICFVVGLAIIATAILVSSITERVHPIEFNKASAKSLIEFITEIDKSISLSIRRELEIAYLEKDLEHCKFEKKLMNLCEGDCSKTLNNLKK